MKMESPGARLTRVSPGTDIRLTDDVTLVTWVATSGKLNGST